MGKGYQCKKCGTIYTDQQSDKFIKTVLRKCPVCSSTEFSNIKIERKMYIEKTNK